MKFKSHKEYRKYRHKVSRKNIIVPLFAISLSLAALIYILNNFYLGIGKNFGASDIIFASFASSAFILFVTPHSGAAKTRKFVISYIIGGVLGYIGYVIIPYIGLYATAAIVAFIVALLMFETNSEHPPALGIAFAFILYNVNIFGVAAVVIGVVILATSKYLMKKVEILEEDIITRF